MINKLELQRRFNKRLEILHRKPFSEKEFHTVVDNFEGKTKEEQREIPFRWSLQFIVEFPHRGPLYITGHMNEKMLEDEEIDLRYFIDQLDKEMKKKLEKGTNERNPKG